MEGKRRTSFLLSLEALRLLKALADARGGIRMTAALEIIIRDTAKREGIK
jgi:hypothetical protein